MKSLFKKLSLNLEGKLFAQLGVQLIVVVLVLLSCLFYYQAYKGVEAEDKAKEVTAELTSKAVLDKIDRNFYERFGDVQAFAVNKLVVNRLNGDTTKVADLQAFVNTMVQYYVLYDLMMVVDLNGKVMMCNTIDKANIPVNTNNIIGKDFGGEEWFRICMSAAGPTGGAWYSDFMSNPDVQQVYKQEGLGMAFAAPIKNDEGKVIGVWYNYASWKEVTQGIREVAELDLHKTYPGSMLLITRNDGEIIDGADSKLIKKGISLDSSITNSAKSELVVDGQPVKFSEMISGWAEAQGAYVYKGRNWKAATIIPKTELTLATFVNVDMLPVILITLLIIGILGYVFYKKVSTSIIDKIVYLRTILLEFSNGNLPQVDQKMMSKDEIGSIAEAVKIVSENLTRLVTVLSNNDGSGINKDEIVVFNNQGILGSSLVSMRENLKKVAEEDQKRIWSTEGMAKFGEILRNNANGLDVLSDNIILNLVKYIGANQGGLFILNDHEAKDSYLELIACYAWDKKKYINMRVNEGEGLVGQAWQEGTIIYLTDVPKNYIRITSGLGDANPNCVIIIPLTVNDKTYGVIEIASFNYYSDYQIDFLKKLAESIASTLSSAKTNERTKNLLIHSQQQTEEMRAQEEEMRQNMEEMQATQEEMERKELEMRDMVEKMQQQEEEMRQNLEEMQATSEEGERKAMNYEAAIERLNGEVAQLTEKLKQKE